MTTAADKPRPGPDPMPTPEPGTHDELKLRVKRLEAVLHALIRDLDDKTLPNRAELLADLEATP